MLRGLFLVFLLFCFCELFSQIVNFKSYPYFHPVTYPDKLAKADLNGDGVTDIVAACEYGLIVCLNYTNQPSQVLRYNGGNFALGDFDADHDIDIAVITGIDSLSILRNSGDGIFTSLKSNISSGTGIGYIMAGDFNNDGKDDIAVGRSFDHKILIYLSAPLLTVFSGPSSYDVGTVIRMDHGDFNNDTFEDIVAINNDQGTFSILINNGNGTFINSVNYSTLTYPTSVTVADVNGDHQKDVIICNAGQGSAISVYTNSGGTFSLNSSFADNLQYVTIETLSSGDFNNDNNTDLTFIDWTKARLTVAHNDGHANFDTLSYALGGQPRCVITGDFNADGVTDIAVGNYGSLQIAYNQGNDKFKIVANGAGYPTGMTTGDFNGDGNPDIASTNYNDGSISILLNNGHGQFQQLATATVGTNPYKIKAANIIGDSNIDLVVIDAKENSIALLVGLGDGTFSNPIKYSISYTPQDLTLADFDNDGKVDVATMNGYITLFLNTGNGFGPPVSVTGVSTTSKISAGDLNGDNLPDIVVSTGQFRSNLFLLMNLGSGNFGSPKSLFDPYTDVHAALIADFTFDGIPDIGFTTDDEVFILKNNGAASFSLVAYPNNIYQAGHLMTGDFTGDGKQDFATAGFTSNAINVFVADSAGSYHEPVRFSYFGNLFDLGTVNLDSDNKDDIAVSGWPYNYLTTMISLPRLDIVTANGSREYGLENPPFHATVTGWPGPGQLNLNFKSDANIHSPIGNYEIKPIVRDSILQNFAVVPRNGELVITPAPLIITVYDTARVYHKDDPQFRFTIAGLRNSDLYPIYVYPAANIDSSPGKYPIIAVAASGGDHNYNATFINGTLTIMPEPITPPYPNPSDGEIKFYSLEEVSYEVYDQTGQKILSGILVKGENSIDLPSTPGFYIIQFTNGIKRKVVII